MTWIRNGASRGVASVACVLSAIAGGVAGAVVLVQPTRGDERVRLDQVPPAVRATIREHLSGGTLLEIERTTDHGRVLYEVDVRMRDGVVEFDVAEDGEFVGYEDDGEEQEDDDDEDEEEDDEEEDEDEDEDEDGNGAGENDLDDAAPAAEQDVLVPTPLADGARFSAVIDHPYMPLSEVRLTELVSDDGERVVREVQDETRNVGGVECLVLAEKEYEDGELAEISYNFFAQDPDGNVYYFGEDVDDYEDGRIVGHGGAWLVGRNADEPCLFLPGRPEVGLCYKPENSPPAAEEWAMIGTLDGQVEIEAGSWDDVLVVLESDHEDRWTERKYYVRGIGLVSENLSLNLAPGNGLPKHDRDREDEGDEGDDDDRPGRP